MATIKWPDVETGQLYEDKISALLTAKGYFVELMIQHRSDGLEIFEYDVLASPADIENERVLFEVKSGRNDVNFTNLFKLFGVMKYTSIDYGAFIYQDCPSSRKQAEMTSVAEDLDITFEEVSNERLERLDSSDELLLDDKLSEVEDEDRGVLFDISRWSRCAQRVAQSKFHELKKSERHESIGNAWDYHKRIQECFFTQDPANRANELYDAYSDYPDVQNDLARYKFGDEFNSETEKAWGSEEHIWLQYIMHLRHSARLRIVKNALQYAADFGRDNTDESADDGSATLFPRGDVDWTLLDTPTSYQETVKRLREHPHGEKIPYLFQVFIQCFGGWYLDTQDDLSRIGRCVGIPSEDVEGCLELYNEFFEYEGGWFTQIGPGPIILKNCPGFIRGAGCFARQRLMGCDDAYEVLTDKDSAWLFGEWHNALFEVLTEHEQIEVLE